MRSEIKKRPLLLLLAILVAIATALAVRMAITPREPGIEIVDVTGRTRTIRLSEIESLEMLTRRGAYQNKFGNWSDEALYSARCSARELDGVILVGGPTRLPVIREAVGYYFGLTPDASIDPDEVVGLGAAIHADALKQTTYSPGMGDADATQAQGLILVAVLL